MPGQNAMEIKEKILSILRRNGPCLPVHVSSGTGLSILFSGAFLSELVSDKKVKISSMKVGSSPVYFLPEHEPSLERYSQHLKSKEKDAFLLLKEKKFLKDLELEPAIRVALRSIKDFAIPFEKEKALYWRYFTAPESEFLIEEKKTIQKKDEAPISITHTITSSQESNEKEERETLAEEKQKPLEIFDKPKKTLKTPKKTERKTAKKSSKKEEGFFNKVKELLNKKGIEILDIADIKNGEITLKVRNKGSEELLIAYNKKKISDADILKAYKKSQQADLPYIILSLGEAPKKTQSIIDAAKSLSGIEKL